MNAIRATQASWSFRLRIVGLLAVAMVPLVILAMMNARDSYGIERERAEARLAEHARGVATLLTRLILQGKTLVAALAINGEQLLALPPAACRSRLMALDDLDAQLPWNFEVADAQGSSECSVAANLTRINIADRDYFDEVRQSGEVVLGSIAIGKRTGIQLLPIAAPILDERKSFRGVIRVAIPTKWLVDYAKVVTGGEPYAIQIYDNHGQLLVDQAGDTAKVAMHADWHAGLDLSRGVQIVHAGDKMVAIAAAWPGRYNVAVIVDSALMTPRSGLSLLASSILAILASLSGLGLAWWLAGRTTMPTTAGALGR